MNKLTQNKYKCANTAAA